MSEMQIERAGIEKVQRPSRQRTVRNRVIAELLAERMPSGRVCDVGTGTGELAHLLARRGYDVTAADIDPSRCQFPELDVQQCDVMAGLPFGHESFDALLATEVIEHMEDPFKAVREFNRVLRPDGLLVLTTPNYGHIERRLKYLLNGSLPRPGSDRVEAPCAGKAHHHVSPMPVPRLKYLLANCGFEAVAIASCLPKRKGWFLLPLVAVVWLVTHLFWSRSRRRRYHIADQMRLILGGTSLIAVGRKRLGPLP